MLASSAHQKTSHFPPKAPSNSCRDLLLNILGFYIDFLSLSRFLDKMPTFAGAGEMRRQNVGFISRDNNDIGMTFLAETLHSHYPEQRQFCPPDDKFRLTVAGGSGGFGMRSSMNSMFNLLPICLSSERLSTSRFRQRWYFPIKL